MISFELVDARSTASEKVTVEIDDDEAASIRSVIMGVCYGLSDSDAATFVFRGFGAEAWPVRVGPELSMFLEQAEGFATWLTTGSEEFQLRFLEQGMGFALLFHRVDEMLSVQFQQFEGWSPPLQQEGITTASMTQQLELLVSRFSTIAVDVLPKGTSATVCQDWSSRICRLLRARPLHR